MRPKNTVYFNIACLTALALLAACSSNHRPQMSATEEAAQYAARARRNYTPPGPPNDPWGPYIVEAAAKYDVPELWVREVVRQESDGRMYENGQLITSNAGAMGLMQVMPGTFDELKARYNLGDDPYDPHDNIMAGTAYLREMYDIFGSPGFLAAYNAGPGKLDDYLTRNKPLPLETRRYVARVGTAIGDTQPQRLSTNTQYAQMPINIPVGPRFPRNGRGAPPVALADNQTSRGQTSRGTAARGNVTVASLDASPRYVAPPPQTTAAGPRPGFHLIAPAMAASAATPRGPSPAAGRWGIQVGAFASEGLARAATESARGHAREQLASARQTVGMVRLASATLYRARLTGLTREGAMAACDRISHGKNGCIVLSPDASSS